MSTEAFQFDIGYVWYTKKSQCHDVGCRDAYTGMLPLSLIYYIDNGYYWYSTIYDNSNANRFGFSIYGCVFGYNMFSTSFSVRSTGFRHGGDIGRNPNLYNKTSTGELGHPYTFAFSNSNWIETRYNTNSWTFGYAVRSHSERVICVVFITMV